MCVHKVRDRMQDFLQCGGQKRKAGRDFLASEVTPDVLAARAFRTTRNLKPIPKR